MKRTPWAWDKEFMEKVASSREKVKFIFQQDGQTVIRVKDENPEETNRKLIQLTKEFGKDYKKIAAQLKGQRTIASICT